MEMVTKAAVGMIAISLGGFISLLAVDVVEPKPDQPQLDKANKDAPVLAKVVLTEDQLKAAALRYSSRYTVIEKEEASKALGSKFRSIDPFGLPTYPTAAEEQIEEEVEPTSPEATAPERITLGHALRTMKINGINLERAEVLFGSRNMFEGDIAEILYKGQTFMAELTEVSGYRLVFVDTKTKEEYTKTLNMLPAPNFEPAKGLDSRLSLQDKTRQLESIGR